jgi:hypothetical protein
MYFSFACVPPGVVAALLFLGVAVGAGDDNLLDARAEAPADLVGLHLVRLVLEGVVQQRGDRLVLVAAVLEHDGGHADQVRDVGDLAALAELVLVQLGRPDQGVAETFAYGCHVRSGGDARVQTAV